MNKKFFMLRVLNEIFTPMNNRIQSTIIFSILLTLLLCAVPLSADNLLLTSDETYLVYDETLEGFILGIKVLPGRGSVLITESSADPDGKIDVYAYRTEGENPINENEKRILEGTFLVNNGPSRFLVDSTPEPDPLLGEAFRIFIPHQLVFGYPWSRNGRISVGRGTWLNIRCFEKPYADYNGDWQDNAFVLDTNQPLVDESGLTREIRDMVPEEILERIEEAGMAINTGDNPPVLEGTFFISPILLVSSNIAGDNPGQRFSDYYYSFSKQNNHNLTIEVSIQSDTSSGDGTGGFIVGENGRFTIFVEADINGSNGWAKTAEIISGEVKANGIGNLEISLVMLEKTGSGYIEVGEGRIVNDGDGFSEKVD